MASANEQLAAPRLGRHRLGHAVRREHHQRVVRHLVQLLDEHGTLAAQLVDHVAVVDDLVADVDRRPVLAQRLLDDVDRTLDPGAEAARAGEEDGQLGSAHRRVTRLRRYRLVVRTTSGRAPAGWQLVARRPAADEGFRCRRQVAAA